MMDAGTLCARMEHCVGNDDEIRNTPVMVRVHFAEGKRSALSNVKDVTFEDGKLVLHTNNVV